MIIWRSDRLDHIPGPFKRLRRWWFRRQTRNVRYDFFRLGEPKRILSEHKEVVQAPRGGIAWIKPEDTP